VLTGFARSPRALVVENATLDGGDRDLNQFAIESVLSQSKHKVSALQFFICSLRGAVSRRRQL
jgi:hypothetical protein